MSPVRLQVATAKHERPNPLRHQLLLSPSLDEVCAQSGRVTNMDAWMSKCLCSATPHLHNQKVFSWRILPPATRRFSSPREPVVFQRNSRIGFMKSPQLLAEPQHHGSLPVPAAAMRVPTSPAPPNNGSAVICVSCQSDHYLVFEKVIPLPHRSSEPATWEIECWCGQCEEFLAVRTTQPPLTPHSILNAATGREHGRI